MIFQQRNKIKNRAFEKNALFFWHSNCVFVVQKEKGGNENEFYNEGY